MVGHNKKFSLKRLWLVKAYNQKEIDVEHRPTP
jgi:hypothetical protein